MAAIDYEAQYDNRARVPENPQIIAGWAQDAADFRQEAPPTALPYGEGERLTIDLFTPVEPRGLATLVFIHGGYWRALDRSYFSHLARGALEHGVSVAIPGYDLCPQVSVADIVDQMRAACRVLAGLGRPLVVAGHSAGGHLAACMLATDWKSLDPELPPALVPAAYAISGLFDLRPLVSTSINEALCLDDDSARAASPLFMPAPAGLSLDAVVGGDESEEFLRQSRMIVDEWGAQSVATRYEAIPDRHHFDVVAPLSDPDSPMTRRLVALSGL
ncbi:MAG: alpha/beta hydrolase [Salinarimonadaceae bacterium]|nr:MAG: alpha/beta hydrolase [Salinarimonadaceae bacterium]